MCANLKDFCIVSALALVVYVSASVPACAMPNKDVWQRTTSGEGYVRFAVTYRKVNILNPALRCEVQDLYSLRNYLVEVERGGTLERIEFGELVGTRAQYNQFVELCGQPPETQ